MWKKFEIYSIQNICFGRKRSCVLRDFVPRGVFFCNPGGGGVLKVKINKSRGCCPIMGRHAGIESMTSRKENRLQKQ